MVSQRPYCPQLGTVAVRQGKVGGTNAAGGYAIFPGAMGSAVTKFFDTEIGVTGMNEFFARRAGFDVVSGAISGNTRAQYYPGAKPIKVKLVVEKAMERIIGAQIIGGEEVTQRINAISIGIQKNMTVHELAKSDTCYAPPLCETWELIALAAEAAIIKLGR
jgi:NADPH-dependent 2,4-dienoyl-CoA reductase/sulfur reductase-like enzyme